MPKLMESLIDDTPVRAMERMNGVLLNALMEKQQRQSRLDESRAYQRDVLEERRQFNAQQQQIEETKERAKKFVTELDSALTSAAREGDEARYKRLYDMASQGPFKDLVNFGAGEGWYKVNSPEMRFSPPAIQANAIAQKDMIARKAEVELAKSEAYKQGGELIARTKAEEAVKTEAYKKDLERKLAPRFIYNPTTGTFLQKDNQYVTVPAESMEEFEKTSPGTILMTMEQMRSKQDFDNALPIYASILESMTPTELSKFDTSSNDKDTARLGSAGFQKMLEAYENFPGKIPIRENGESVLVDRQVIINLEKQRALDIIAGNKVRGTTGRELTAEEMLGSLKKSLANNGNVSPWYYVAKKYATATPKEKEGVKKTSWFRSLLESMAPDVSKDERPNPSVGGNFNMIGDELPPSLE